MGRSYPALASLQSNQANFSGLQAHCTHCWENMFSSHARLRHVQETNLKSLFKFQRKAAASCSAESCFFHYFSYKHVWGVFFFRFVIFFKTIIIVNSSQHTQCSSKLADRVLNFLEISVDLNFTRVQRVYMLSLSPC